MPSPCVDAFQDAINNTSRVLFRSLDLSKWGKLTIVYLLSGGSGGGGGGGGFPGGGGGNSHNTSNSAGGLVQSSQDLMHNFFSLKDRLGNGINPQDLAAISIILVIGVVTALAALALMYVSSVFQFIFLERFIKHGNKKRIYRREGIVLNRLHKTGFNHSGKLQGIGSGF